MASGSLITVPSPYFNGAVLTAQSHFQLTSKTGREDGDLCRLSNALYMPRDRFHMEMVSVSHGNEEHVMVPEKACYALCKATRGNNSIVRITLSNTIQFLSNINVSQSRGLGADAPPRRE